MSSIDYHLKELEIALTAADPRQLNPTVPDHCASVLDVGCGIGQTLLACPLTRGSFACGVDIDEAAVRYAKQLTPSHHFVCATAERLPLRSLSFDLVISRVALPFVHVPKALGEIARVTREGGSVWFTLHSWQMARSDLVKAIRSGSLRNILFRLYVIANGVWFHIAGNQFRYPFKPRWCESFQTVRGMTRAMLRAGFEQVQVQVSQFFVVTAVKMSAQNQAGATPDHGANPEVAAQGAPLEAS